MVKLLYNPISEELSEIIHDVHFETDNKTIQELIYHYKDGNLNLKPAFQRDSVWRENQRRRLIKSLYENMPIPSIFLFERDQNGRSVYDVIDGKQRLESIFMFMGLRGFARQRFWFNAEWEVDGKHNSDRCYWKQLELKEQMKILSYPMQTTIIKGSHTDIAEIFVRINSTGSSLKPQEIRKARYLKSDFLRECVKLARKKSLQEYLMKNKIISKDQIARQKHVELISELILSIHHNGPINKKRAIDEAMKGDAIKGRHLKKTLNVFNQTLRSFKGIFPNIKETRFSGIADFYTLFMLVWKWKYSDRLALSNSKRRKLAQAYLSSFGFNIDQIRQKQRNLKRIEEGEQLFANYLRTVQSATDDISNRKSRENILDALLSDCFKPKDPYRLFNKEQRRIIWYLSDGRCKQCHKKLTITNFHIDHITPHSKGGKTNLKNAQLLCPKHNLEKSNK